MASKGVRAGLVLACLAGSAVAPSLHAQDLAPRAYTITPVGSNAFTLADAYNDGPLQLEGASPIENGTARLNVPSLTYYRAFSLLGRSANVIAGVAYGWGDFDGSLFGDSVSTYRSGFFDPVVRVSVNLLGGPAMSLPEMMKWRQKTLLGVSLKVTAPTGQYDSTRLINLGTNRWAFKPELGLSRRWGNWILDVYGAVWLFTENPEFFSRNEWVPGVQSQKADPVYVAETHLSYDFRPRLWVSLDGNFWRGGTLTVGGVEVPATLQENSRVGVTASFPVTYHNSVKVSLARGAYIRFGGDFKVLSVAWQYSWITGASPPPKARTSSSPRQE